MRNADFSLDDVVFVVEADSDCEYQVWGPVNINEIIVSYTNKRTSVRYGFYQCGVTFSASHCGKEARDIFRRECDAKRSASLRNRNMGKRLSSLRD